MTDDQLRQLLRDHMNQQHDLARAEMDPFDLEAPQDGPEFGEISPEMHERMIEFCSNPLPVEQVESHVEKYLPFLKSIRQGPLEDTPITVEQVDRASHLWFLSGKEEHLRVLNSVLKQEIRPDTRAKLMKMIENTELDIHDVREALESDDGDLDRYMDAMVERHLGGHG